MKREASKEKVPVGWARKIYELCVKKGKKPSGKSERGKPVSRKFLTKRAL